MKILIVYATYSSGTQTVAELMSESFLKKGHTVTLQDALITHATDFNEYELILMGSPSWLIHGVQGQPHQNYTKLMGEIGRSNLVNKKFALFGLGHSDYYLHFCGAVDVFEKAINGSKGNLIIDSLRIDAFYFNQKENELMIHDWLSKLQLILDAVR